MRVVEDNEWSIPAELETELFDRARALAHQQPADFSRTSEAQFAYGGIRGQLAPNFLCAAGDYVEDTRRHARRFGKFGKCKCREWRFDCWLHDHGAPGGKRRSHFARDHGRWKVPGRNGRNDSDRLLEHDDPSVRGMCRDNVAVNAFAFLGEPFE